MDRVLYAITAFALLLSFVGTVLGGLWADDSWGRFWGWDPKENGALLIVTWCAIMLHAMGKNGINAWICGDGSIWQTWLPLGHGLG